jgi:hypothetical protein
MDLTEAPVRNGYHAAVRDLMSPILPEGYSGFVKAHLGQCSVCKGRVVTELPFGNGDRGEVHLCRFRGKELGIEDEECATRRRCRSFEARSEEDKRV